jgi:hypothetical protein
MRIFISSIFILSRAGAVADSNLLQPEPQEPTPSYLDCCVSIISRVVKYAKNE